MSGLTARLDVPLGDHAPRAARAAVHAVLTGWGYARPDWLDGAMLVVSELVTNAVVHGGGCLVLEVEAHDRTVVIAVTDGSSVVPRRREPDRTGGRGLAVIDALSARWGVDDHEGGKRVWAELPTFRTARKPVGADRAARHRAVRLLAPDHFQVRDAQ